MNPFESKPAPAPAESKTESKEERSESPREVLHRSLYLLDRLHQDLIKKYAAEPKQELSFEVRDPRREEWHEVGFMSYGEDGSKIIKHQIKKPGGNQIELNYHMGYQRSQYLTSEAYLSYKVQQGKHRTEYKFDDHAIRQQDIEAIKINRRQVKGLERDGMHVKTEKQVEWIIKWRRFWDLLRNDDVFRQALKNLKENKDDKNALSHIESYEFDALKADMNKIVDDWEMFWNAAYGTHSWLTKKKFPRNKAPFKLGPCPPDMVIPYKEAMQVFSDARARLAQAVELLDEHKRRSKGSKGPYR